MGQQAAWDAVMDASGDASRQVALKKYAAEIAEATRREWAEKIRVEFAPYHDHSESGGECGSCGAKQAADFMDPDKQK